VGSADLEVGDTAGLETCATTDRQFEPHPTLIRSLTGCLPFLSCRLRLVG